mmetsp:Transcript_33764/g.107226  ORF Transcript_33764/g.107226 Transcript_33764/m.107226 type:complete len:271 (+) Transcript_33764:167-979(+)
MPLRHPFVQPRTHQRPQAGSRGDPTGVDVHPPGAKSLCQWLAQLLGTVVHLQGLEQLTQRVLAKRVLTGHGQHGGLIRELHCLLAPAVTRKTADQGPVGVHVRAIRPVPSLDLLQGLKRTVNATVVEAGTDEASTDQGVYTETQGLSQAGPDDLKGFVKILALAPHFHDDGNCEVGGLYGVLRHVSKQPVGELKVGVPHATVEQRVVDDRVSFEPAVQHLLEDAECLAQVAVDAMTLDNVRKGDCVGLAAILLHLLQEYGGLRHVASPGL